MNFPNCIVQITLLTLILGCSNIETQPVTKNNNLNNQTTVSNSQQSSATKPATKNATFSIEGEKTEITLKLYQDSNFTTYFPAEDFLVEPMDSGEGRAVKFIVNFGGEKNEDAYVDIVFLNNVQKYPEVVKFINGQNGLIATNKWRVVSESKNTPYPWAKEKIVFSAGKNIVGNIYIGEENGRAFYVITQFPDEYSDGFTPRADLILSNLQIP